MKIAIIGGGWVGSHLAYKLKDKYDIHLFEKNKGLLAETSTKNQNRLHLGYHYPRNYNTRQMCYDTFDRFLKDYPNLVKNVDSNIYCVPTSKSILDFKTYCTIIGEHNTVNTPVELRGIEGCVNTQEKYIDFTESSKFFNTQLQGNITIKSISKTELKILTQEYDLVVNTTNNSLTALFTPDEFYYENTLTLLYEKVQETSFNAVTLVDGEFFSIYPYLDHLYTVTHVKHTPISKSSILLELKEPVVFDDRIKLFEESILEYFPKFREYFKYRDYYISTKVKPFSETANRYPMIKKEGNLIEIFTGKIQGIYIIEDYILNLLQSYES